MRKSGDPFEVDPLPRTFYYPSQEKVLPEEQRKICLSPNHRKEETPISPADEKFLKQTDHMKIHEIPTRENGTIDADQSSSSKFDESWPSTERVMVSTPEADAESPITSKTHSSEGTEIPFRPLPHSTLARYIHRFRHAPPSSRQERDHSYFDSGKVGEFWWLSPSPPSSSTPKDSTPPDQLLGPSPRPSLSPKLKKNATRRSPSPSSPVLKTRKVLSPSKSSVEGLDAKTVDLQQRARKLLEKSESTLESSSSEAHRPKKAMQYEHPRERTRGVSSAHKSSGRIQELQQPRHQLRPAPPPEEDILYQWRLARKMEKAYEQVAKWGPSRSSLPSVQVQALSSASTVLPRTKTPLPVPLGDMSYQATGLRGPTLSEPVRSLSLTTETQTTFAVSTAVLSDRLAVPSRVIPSHFDITSQATPSLSQSQAAVEQSGHTYSIIPSAGEPIARPVGPQSSYKPFLIEQAKFESGQVPSHMHLSCDILPCPHQKALIENEMTDKVPLSIPVVDIMLGEAHKEERESERNRKPYGPLTRQLSDERGDYLERAPPQDEANYKTPLSVPVVDSAMAKVQEGEPSTERSAKPSGSVSRELFDKRLTSHRQQSESDEPTSNKRLHHLQEGCDVLPATEKPKVRRDRKPKPREIHKVSEASDPNDLLSGVIGEVVSERLFSTPRSSTSSLAESQESVLVRKPKPQDHGHALEQENTAPDVISDSEFSDDEILKMLRQRACRYREQLRQIDSLLNQQSANH
ncbi:proline and serine-rich protein 3-like isoform X1 [Montipora foliosa]|uniref:proline and serine-rich protein 3-like isoform X1 n=2 Tax=Montipora foliosa TaxID=591990 RepID=UPI0035F161C8